MHDTLSSLIERALMGNQRPLEFYLRDHSRLPGARANLELANDVGHLLATFIPRYPENVRTLINYFANGDRKMVASNTPAEFIMLCGIIAFGTCAAVQAEWREETFHLLDHYSSSSYWRVREGVAIAYQQLVLADKEATMPHLLNLATSGNYLQQRAAIATIAEPILLTSDLLDVALQLQDLVMTRAHNVPMADRKCEDFRVLRRTLGYTLSVVVAVAPEPGFALMREYASWRDSDIHWILRENLKKKRLARFADDIEEITRLLA